MSCSQWLRRIELGLTCTLCASVGLLSLTPSAAARSAQSGGRVVAQSGGPLPDQDAAHDCIPAAERARVARRIRLWYALHGSSPIGAPVASQLYTFFPMGGRLYRDVFTNNFVDLDPSPGLLDWNCSDRTYDGHQGNDTLLRSFGEQAIGVPIFAALDGVVIATNDGQPDMNTVWAGQSANYVVVDHGNGKLGLYWHMRNGSVAVSPGQIVKAGQQIGLAASSGNSNWPHLHFEEQLLGNVVEPYSGPCNPGPSHWAQQVPIDYSLELGDFGLSYISPAGTQVPYPMPRSGQWPQSNTVVYVWGLWTGLPASSTWRVVFLRPDGVVAYTSGSHPFNNGTYFRYSWWQWGFSVPSMQTIAGTWKVKFFVNNVLQVNAPLEVVPILVPGFNRPPEPIAVAFSPAFPVPGDVLACEVQTDLALDDLDWDILRYHYVWKVNGGVVRNVISAAHSDYLARNSWSTGAVVTCDVTPNDGTVDGATATARFPNVTSYCTAGTTTNGCVAAISGTGTPSASSGSGFTISVAAVEGQKQGLLFYGLDNSAFVPTAWGASTSYLCVKSPTQRTISLGSGGTTNACNGAFALDWNAYVAANPGALGNPFGAGQHVFAQAWFRDPPNPKTTALSNALEFAVGP